MIGMLNWLVCLGRFDISFATSSLSNSLLVHVKGIVIECLEYSGT